MPKFSFLLRLGLAVGVLSSCFYLLSPALHTLAQTSVYLPTIRNGGGNTPTATTPAATGTSTPKAETTPALTPTATTTPAPTTTSVAYTSLWLRNTTGETSPEFTNVPVNVQSVYTKTVAGQLYQCITASGIPNHEHTLTAAEIQRLNSRPKAATDFVSGATTASAGQRVHFGEDIGYRSSGCTTGAAGYGFWPPGPACPTNQNRDQCFPLTPEATTNLCNTGMGSIGTWLNGVAIYGWTDGQSYQNRRVWENDAYHAETYDLDLCPGHSAMGDYHTHSHPLCLQEQLGDTGAGHSPIYGFAADGYPVYGPWHANGVLAQSCWQTRNYEDANSPTGCGGSGQRSCLLVDQYDISKGTVAASQTGPKTSDTVTTMSGNQLVAVSGYYFQDYYYDSSCTAQGPQYLDEHNGHNHDGLGYHYHVSRTQNADGTLKDLFPYYIGPAFAGTLTSESFAMCDTGGGPPPPLLQRIFDVIGGK